MKPDSMLIEPALIVNTHETVAQQGAHKALEALRQQEPALAAYVQGALSSAAGRLTLAGAPGQVVRGVHEELLTVLLTCVQSVRRGHYELWKDTALGTPLAELAPDLAAPTNQAPHRKPVRRPEENS